MILLLDVGNTRMKWAALETGGTFIPVGSLVHAGQDLAALVDAAWRAMPQPDRVVVSNVAGPAFAAALRDWTRASWGVEPYFVIAPPKGWGVTNAYIEPHRLGTDRWAALVAVHHLVKAPACIVDCGTAITIDALAENGEHLGGLIVPGLSMMRHALVTNTRGIPDEGEGVVALLARSTRDAVTGGTLYAAVAVIDRVIGDVTAELARPVTCVITGGDAERVMSLLAAKCRYEPDLVLHGLKIIAEGEA